MKNICIKVQNAFETIFIMAGYETALNKSYIMVCKPDSDSAEPFYHQVFEPNHLAEQCQQLQTVLHEQNIQLSGEQLASLK